MAGQCARFSNDIKLAIELLTRSISLERNDAYIYLGLGIALQMDGQYEVAISFLENATKISPNLYSAYNSLGFTYKKMGQYTLALDWYRKAEEVRINVAIDEVLKERDKCFSEEIDEHGKSCLVPLPYYFEKTRSILMSDPFYATIKNNMGVCFMELGFSEKARSLFQESIEFTPDGYEFQDPHSHIRFL